MRSLCRVDYSLSAAVSSGARCYVLLPVRAGDLAAATAVVATVVRSIHTVTTAAAAEEQNEDDDPAAAVTVVTTKIETRHNRSSYKNYSETFRFPLKLFVSCYILCC